MTSNTRNPRTQHSEEAKTHALAVYAETGSTQSAAEASGVPRRTIDNWLKRDPEIDAKLDALKRAARERMAHLFVEGAALAARETIDRLQNGDWVSQGGKMVRRPVPARETSFIAAVFTDKHAALTGSMAKQSDAERNLVELCKRLVEDLERKRAAARTPITLEPEVPDDPGASA